METVMAETREQWGSRLGFTLAVAGSAVGLGNLWKFPYITGMNGGGAFVLVYLVCILLVGAPLLICEIALGRATASCAVRAFSRFTRDRRTAISTLCGYLLILTGLLLAVFRMFGYGFLLAGAGFCLIRYSWKTVGVLTGVLVPALILSYYGVIGGWTLLYIWKSFTGQLDFTTQTQAAETLTPILAAPKSMWPAILGTQWLFMAAAGIVVFAGVKKGIERASKYLMPLLFLLLLVLAVRGISLEGAGKGLDFFLKPDFSKLSAESVLVALGHSFFTLSLAMGIAVTYGSYLSKKEDIVRGAFLVIGLDTLMAVVAGIAVFSTVFACGFDPASGPGLIFNVLPAAFNRIPGGLGWLWNGLFFLMVFIAALTSGISLLEPVVGFLREECRLPRRAAAVISSVAIALLGTLSALSVLSWDNFPRVQKTVAAVFGDAHGSFFDLLDSFCSNWMLPLGGFAIAIFVGWVWGAARALREIRRGASPRIDSQLFLLLAGCDQMAEFQREKRDSLFTPALLWAFCIRWISPALVILAFLYGIGLFR